MNLKPQIFHISDGRMNREIDEHLNLGEGGYDFEFIREMIQKAGNKYITIETPRYNQNSLDEDIKNLKLANNMLSKV
jgi:endonuclease IV